MDNHPPAAATGEQTPPGQPPAGRTPPACRGRLQIRDKAIERIATQVVTDADGTLTATSVLDRITARGLPRVDVQVAGGHVYACAHLAVAWPRPLAQVAAQTRDRLTDRLATLTGLTIERIDVRIDAVLPPPDPPDPSTSRRATTPADSATESRRRRRGRGAAPVAAPAAAISGTLIAAVLLGVGVLGLDAALVAAGAVAGPSWADAGIAAIDGLARHSWMAAPALLVAVIGLSLIWAAIKPRAITAIPLEPGHTGWVRPVDIARIASDTARTLPQATTVSSHATRKHVTVTVTTADTETDALRAQVTDLLHTRLAPLGDRLRISVTMRQHKVPS